VTNDVGIGRLIPQYTGVNKGLISPADTAYWEALYTDGTVLRETDGRQYIDIDRGRLSSFRIIHAGETLIETFPNTERGSTGHNLVYRKRVGLGQGTGRHVLTILGWAPMGPVFLLDIANSTYRVLDKGFDPLDLDGYPPQTAMPGEPTNLVGVR
jgi:hypothetical protein